MKYRQYSKIRVERIIVAGFLSLIMAGTLLIYLFNGLAEKSISFIDALFTSTSAVCVTGLIVVDTAVQLPLSSQITVMILFQLGGIGVMTAATAMMLLLRQKVGIRERLLFTGGIGVDSLAGAVKLIIWVVRITLAFELVGSMFLLISFSRDYPLAEAVFHSLFQGISAFCNAGFSTFSSNLSGYATSFIVPGTVMFLIFWGGIGFIPIVNIMSRIKKKEKIRHHTLLVIVTSCVLILTGTVLVALFEWNGALGSYDPFLKLWNSLFLSISSRTAGFNTVNTVSFSSVAAFIICMLMIIGASPGSTGGGIKTTTFSLIVLSIRSYIEGKDRTVIWYRSIPSSDVIRAFSVAGIYLCTILFSVILLSVLEAASFGDLVFEVISALGTVGLSRGITASLSVWGKIVLILLMFWGRIGMLTLIFGLIRRDQSAEDIIYPEVNIPLG